MQTLELITLFPFHLQPFFTLFMTKEYKKRNTAMNQQQMIDNIFLCIVVGDGDGGVATAVALIHFSNFANFKHLIDLSWNWGRCGKQNWWMVATATDAVAVAANNHHHNHHRQEWKITEFPIKQHDLLNF